MSRCYQLFALIVIIGWVSVYAMPAICKAKVPFTDPPPDYCSEPHQPHLGCNNNNTFAVACGKKAEIFPMTENNRRLILRQHNVYRNIVAKGTLHVLPVAGRMFRMKWDENLAQLAEYAVKLCSINRLTSSFSTTLASSPGFNAAYNKYPKKEEQDEIKIMSSHLKAWYDEYRYMTVQSLLSNHSVAGQEISHFTQIMVGLNDRVGCAVAKFERNDFKNQLMICFYGCMKAERQLTYSLAKVPAENCKCGSDRKYKNLCNVHESVGDCGVFMDHNHGNADYQKVTTPRPTAAPIRPKPLRTPSHLINWILRHIIRM